jgi:penicillin-binding protein 1B
MTPIDVTAGYTAFAANGVRAEPLFIRSVVAGNGSTVESNSPSTHPVLDPRVAFLTTSLMEDVINHGTGYPVRQIGFTAPAAGKTGTSHDGWFAGYTSNLLCVVWVGFDDNRDLGLAGGEAAAPIWAEFMKRAVALPRYRDTQNFEPPPGIVAQSVDPQTGQLATPSCPQIMTEYFIAGTEPNQYCQLHGGSLAQSGPASWLSHLFGKGSEASGPRPPEAPPSATKNGRVAIPPPAKSAQEPASQGQTKQPEKKKGLFDKIFGIFGGEKQPEEKQPDTSKPH